MNQRKPIKRSKALIEFSKDHHFGLLLVWKIRKGLQLGVLPQRIGDYAIFFYQQDLLAHFKEEEQTLFILLPDDDPHRLQAEREHEEVYQHIETLQADRANTEVLVSLAGLLERHIRFEERTLFPHIESRLSEKELNELAQSAVKRPHDIDAQWNDHFWER